MIQSAPPPQPVRELPISDTVSEAYRSVFSNFAAWFRIMLGPAALAVPMAAIGQVLLRTEQEKMVTSGLEGPEAAAAFLQAAWPEMLLGNLLSLIPYVFFAVAWHRFLLLGERPATPVGALWPMPRHLRFYLFTLLLFGVVAAAGLSVGLVGALIAALFSGATGPNMLQLPLFLLIFMLTLYVAARLQFTFPAVAVDERYGFLDSWRNTRGQGWRFLFVLSCTFLPPLFFNFFMALILSSTGFTLLSLINSFILAAIGLLTTAIVISAVSIAFRTCTGWIPPQQSPPPATV